MIDSDFIIKLMGDLRRFSFNLCAMNTIKPLELHQLAMEEVGKFLEAEGYQFLAVNSQPKRSPQFVCVKDKSLYFVLVKACLYPENPKTFALENLEKIKDHARTNKAQLFFAGVGFANAENYELPLTKKDPYAVNFNGLQKVD